MLITRLYNIYTHTAIDSIQSRKYNMSGADYFITQPK